MEVRVYNPELQLIGIVENFISLLWNKKYSSAGTFEFVVPITDNNVKCLRRGNIIAYLGAKEAGVIEGISAKQNERENILTITGRFLESYLDRRLIYSTSGDSPAYNFSGNIEIAMRTIFTNAVPIPLMTLGDIKGFTGDVSFQATYQNLLKYESKLADSAALGFRCIPDFVDKTITFDIYKGLDRSAGQTDRARVFFSDEYANISDSIYTENDQLLKTVCYVGGQGEGANREWVVVGDTTATGLDLREVKLNATDIDSSDITPEEYTEKLAQRGEELLSNTDILVQSFECKSLPNSNFEYGKHYDLGDIITVKKDDWNIELDLRITEISEIYENGNIKILPTFGNPLPDSIDWEDK